MQRKRLLLVFLVSCICLLPLDASASRASAAAKILKGTEKAARGHYDGFSRAGIVAEKYGRNNYPNRKHDSTYWDTLNRIRPIYMDSSIKWDSLNANRYGNRQRLRDFAPYAESPIEDISVDENAEFKKDSVVQTFGTDSLKKTVDTKDNANKSNVTTTYNSDESDGIAWKLFLGLLILIVAIICCSLKIFSKKGKTK